MHSIDSRLISGYTVIETTAAIAYSGSPAKSPPSARNSSPAASNTYIRRYTGSSECLSKKQICKFPCLAAPDLHLRRSASHPTPQPAMQSLGLRLGGLVGHGNVTFEVEKKAHGQACEQASKQAGIERTSRANFERTGNCFYCSSKSHHCRNVNPRILYAFLEQ